MSAPALRADSSEFDVIFDEQPDATAPSPSGFPDLDRDELARKIQSTDGCSQVEAETQIDAFARSFRSLTGTPARAR